ncbi:hypothetical protein [Cystobacter ferrugineus]|uniref:Uncharacterized protein n=1 Tax=Cystobacter ferrugineus TaxID=83449 RepID=A0A1L9B342_9BACT|nr:hypothetical protein [Cystobacter ferrugineus]OJH36679.1 hypothetical protein BON30_33595 [Cystobacter ferrugineus]
MSKLLSIHASLPATSSGSPLSLEWISESVRDEAMPSAPACGTINCGGGGCGGGAGCGIACCCSAANREQK